VRRFLKAQNGTYRFGNYLEDRTMPRLVHSSPKYRKHKASGQAVVTISGRDHYLGLYRSKASRREYDRLVGEWLARDRQPLLRDADGLTVAELAARYLAFASKKYVRQGQPTAEQHHIRTALRHLLRPYDNHLAADFSPMCLKVVRQSMIESGWARNYVNSQVGVLVRMFKWAVTERLLPASVHASLDLVDGLRRGESAARETAKRSGIDDTTVAATLPHLSPTVRAMIELQRATGARPGEICVLRPCDIDRSGQVWEYRPMQHKGQLHDRDRCIYIGPNGQAILRPFLLRPADAFCFSPVESVGWHRAERHDARTTPESCGNAIGTNRKRRPKRLPRGKYDVASYPRAIHRACDEAFQPANELAKRSSETTEAWLARLTDPQRAELRRWQSAHRWSPHQLRHTMATRVRKEFDIEAAKAVLGHSATNVTGIYAEVDRCRAIEVAKAIG
jgi:integrase